MLVCPVVNENRGESIHLGSLTESTKSLRYHDNHIYIGQNNGTLVVYDRDTGEL